MHRLLGSLFAHGTMERYGALSGPLVCLDLSQTKKFWCGIGLPR